MSANFKNSETKKNLMRAFAGESQARNRYTFAASQARKSGLYVIEAVFAFTATQEKEHAEIFYNHLQTLSGETIAVDGGYPVDLYPDMLSLLKAAQHNEYEEHDPVYRAFAETAAAEGFPRAASSFSMIAQIEKTHGDRFGRFAQLIEEDRLFLSDVETGWMCLNCGYVYTGKEAPEKCPVCDHARGYFIRLSLSPISDHRPAGEA